MLKRPSADALGLLVVLVFVTFSGVVAYWVYLTVLWLGFGDKAAYWSAIVSIGVMGVLFYSRGTQMPSDTLTMWGLTLLRWVLIAAAVLATGIGVLIVIINSAVTVFVGGDWCGPAGRNSLATHEADKSVTRPRGVVPVPPRLGRVPCAAWTPRQNLDGGQTEEDKSPVSPALITLPKIDAQIVAQRGPNKDAR